MDIGNLKIITRFSDQVNGSGWYQQAARFALVGLLNTGLDWAIYLLMAQSLGAAPIFAKAVSYSAGVLNSYYLNRSWTFQSRAIFTKAFPPFLGISSAGILINSGCMYIAIYLIKLDNLPALILATAAAFGWNFVASRRFVFIDQGFGPSSSPNSGIRDQLKEENSLDRSNVDFRRQLIRPWDEGINRFILRVRHINWAAIFAFVFPFTLYNLTLAPTIYNLDSAELTTAVATGGILRATGYPLYLVLGKGWAYLPLGDVGFRMNLFSAFWGASTIFLADRTLRRLAVGGWARLGALGLLTAVPFFWSLSLIAEVYTLHTAIMAAVILLLIRWGEHPSSLRLAVPIFLVTLSLGNHAATVLLIPGCVWYVINKHPWQMFRPKFYLTALPSVLSGAAIFLYLPLQYGSSPAFNYAGHFDATGAFIPVNLQTLDGFLWLVTGRAFAGQMFGYSPPEIWPEIREFGQQLWIAFLGIGILPGLLGLGGLLKRKRCLGGMLVLMLFANALFYINYRVVDKETMYLPVYVIWAIGLGYGYQILIDWFRPRGRATALEWLFRGAIVGAVLISVAWNWPRVDLARDWSTREQSESILGEVEPNAIVFGWWDTIPAVQYLQLVEGRRPDVQAINRFLIDAHDMNLLIRQEIGNRPIYINNPSIELLKITRATRVGSLYKLEPQD